MTGGQPFLAALVVWPGVSDQAVRPTTAIDGVKSLRLPPSGWVRPKGQKGKNADDWDTEIASTIRSDQGAPNHRLFWQELIDETLKETVHGCTAMFTYVAVLRGAHWILFDFSPQFRLRF
jgi:hypothetical protein